MIQINESFHNYLARFTPTRMSNNKKRVSNQKSVLETYNPKTVKFTNMNDNNEPYTGTVTEADMAAMDTVIDGQVIKHILHLYAGKNEMYLGSMIREDGSDRLVDLKDHLHQLTNPKYLVVSNIKVFSDDEPTEISNDGE